ncbi:unnamed protein product [Somion occarium]|uniref:homogentisate 1,2-dioxygenase n=1 Tax=Somion occarium TaxID=3059160 RepID=A0ABP1E984_9APHY
MSVTAKAGYTISVESEPYIYQVGFGNSFASEALDGVLPIGQNSPQKVKYDLYAEDISGTTFTTPRAQNQRTWFYRIQPSVSHDGFKTSKEQNPCLESDFSPSNPKVHVKPTQMSWDPFKLPTVNEQVDFVEGLKTMGGNGSAVSHEGLAIHVYMANTSMQKKAFVNSDGDLLIVPQEGRLDIQTELGKMMVRPGEIVVVQSGIKFKVSLPDGPSRGYVQEVYGAHYELPELGPLGANGMANVRDFEHPVASFDIDQSDWEVQYKIGGKLFSCFQDHTPFDVVAWHGNYVPYKYALEKFITVGSITKDHTDPSVFCVLIVKSKIPGLSLSEFCVIGPRWDVASQTFRPPYFHRNTAGELIGVIFGDRAMGPPGFAPGGMNYRTSFCPHGITTEVFKAGSEMELAPMRVGEGSLLFLIEPSTMLMLTDYAVKGNGFQGKSLVSFVLDCMSDVLLQR